MRRAQAELGHVIIQIAIAAAVVVMLWMVVTDIATGDSRYRDSILSTDNALVIDAMHASSDGVLQVAYLIRDPEQEVVLRDRTIGFGNVNSEVRTTRTFAGMDGVEVYETTFSPRFYELVKTQNSFGVNVVTAGDSCPILGEPPDWQDARFVALGLPTAQIILEDALTRYGITVQQQPRGAEAGLDFNTHDDDQVEIVVGQDVRTWTVACLLGEELADRSDLELVVIREPRVTRDGIIRVRVPEGEELVTQEALTCAYKRVVKQEGVSRGC